MPLAHIRATLDSGQSAHENLATQLELLSAQREQLAERHREVLSTMYPVTHAKHVLLGRMYEVDPRFSQHFNTHHPELTGWLVKAINANATRHGVNPESASWQ